MSGIDFSKAEWTDIDATATNDKSSSPNFSNAQWSNLDGSPLSESEKQNDYENENSTLSVVKDRLTKGSLSLMSGVQSMGIDRSSKTLDVFDQVDNGASLSELMFNNNKMSSGSYDNLAVSQYIKASPEERKKLRDEIDADLSSSIESVQSRNKTISEIPSAPIVEATGKAFDEGRVADGFKLFMDSPLSYVAEIGLTSLPQALPGLIISAVTKNPRLGMGLGSYTSDYASQLTELMQKQGVDINDPKALRDAFANQKLMEDVRLDATARGLVVGKMDSVSGGFASKVLIPSKGKVANAFAQVGAGAAAGAAGEALGQQAAGQDIQWSEVFNEAIGEGFQAPVEVGTAALSGAREKAKREASKLTPEDEASPLSNDDIIAGNQDTADISSKDRINKILSENNIPNVDANVTVTLKNGRSFKGKILDIEESDQSDQYTKAPMIDESGAKIDGFMHIKTGEFVNEIPVQKPKLKILLPNGLETSVDFDTLQENKIRIEEDFLQITDEISPKIQEAYSDYYGSPEQPAITGPGDRKSLPSPSERLSLPPSDKVAGDGFVMGANTNIDPMASRPTPNSVPVFDEQGEQVGWHDKATGTMSAFPGMEKRANTFEGKLPEKKQKLLPAPKNTYGDGFVMGEESNATPEQYVKYQVDQMPAGRQVSLLEIAKMADTNKKQASKIRDRLVSQGVLENDGVKYIVKDKDAATTTHAAGYGNKQQQAGILERAAAKLEKQGIASEVKNIAGETRLQGINSTPEQNKLIQEAIQYETQISINKAERMKNTDLTKQSSLNIQDFIKANGGLKPGQLTKQEMEQSGLSPIHHIRQDGKTLDEMRLIAEEERFLPEFSSPSDFKDLLMSGSNAVAFSDINKRLDEMEKVDPEREAADKEQAISEALKEVEKLTSIYNIDFSDKMKKEAAEIASSGTDVINAMDTVVFKFEQSTINEAKSAMPDTAEEFYIPFEMDEQTNENTTKAQEERRTLSQSSKENAVEQKASPVKSGQAKRGDGENEGSTEVNDNPEIDEYAPEMSLKDAQDVMKGRYPHKVPSSERKAIADRFKTSWDQFTRALDEVGYKAGQSNMDQETKAVEDDTIVQDANIGRSWTSVWGKQTIKAIISGDLYQVIGSDGAERRYNVSNIDEIIKDQEYKTTQEYKDEVAERKIIEQEKADRDARLEDKNAKIDTEIKEFTDSKGMPTPNAKKASNALKFTIRHNGEVKTRKQMIEDIVNKRNGVVRETKSGRIIEMDDGSFLEQNVATKTGLDYAEFLNSKKGEASGGQSFVDKEIGEAIGADERTAPEDTQKKRTLQQMRADAPMRAKTQQDGLEGGLFGTKDLVDQAESKEDSIKTDVKPDYDYSGTFTLADYEKTRERMFEGDISAEELKSAFESLVRSEEDIKAELNKLTIKQLGKYAGFRSAGDKKQYIVKSAYSSIEGRFHVGDSISYMMGTKHSDAVRKAIEKQTDEDIQNYSKRLKEQRADYDKRMEELKKSVQNPETFEEFRDFVRIRGRDALSVDQQQVYDELRAERNREQDKTEKERSAKITVNAAKGVSMSIVKGVHTKKGNEIFTVTLSGERLEKDAFSELKSASQKLGGYYSSFRGNGATPGFIFNDELSANKFMELQSGEVSTLDVMEKKSDERVKSSAEKLRSMADALEESANKSLNADRRTNTARQSRQAASSMDSANSDVAMAKTMRNIADAIESGEAKNLSLIQNKTQIETLNSYARRSMFAWVSKEIKRLESEGKRADREQLEDKGVMPEHIVEAKLPLHGLGWDYVFNPLSRAAPKNGYKRDLSSAERLANNKEKINVANPRHMEIITSLMNGYTEEYKYSQLIDQVSDFKRLNRMGIRDLPSLRAALREYISFKGTKARESKLSKMERDLIGRNIQGFFPTPKTLINNMIETIGVSEGMDVLEPEAGKGDIADALKDRGANVDVVEMNYTLQEILKEKGHNIIGQDMLELSPSDKLYDRIVMNPPFEKYQDIQHVQHAYSLLKPGGELAAIMSSGPFNNSQSKAQEFRDWLDGLDHTANQNDEGSFKGSESFRQTGVNTYTVTIKKPESPSFRMEEKITQPASQFEQDKNVIISKLKAQLKRLKIDDKIAVKLFEKLERLDENGKFDGEAGAYFHENLIGISLSENITSGTDYRLNHEAIHALRSLDLFTKGEWNTLVKTAWGDQKIKDWVNDLYPNLSLEGKQEEAVAEYFAAWSRNEQKPLGLMKLALQKIENFFDAVKQVFNGEGFNTTRDIFENVTSGKVGKRSAQNNTSNKSRLMHNIAKSVGDTVLNFKKWFGDSKVVDEDGKPLVVYHGTGANIYAFDTSDRSLDQNAANPLGENIGSFFTANKYHAKDFGLNIQSVYLSIDNPMVFETQEDFRVFMRKNSGRTDEIRDSEGYIIKEGVFENNMRSVIESLGHDGVVINRPNYTKSKSSDKAWYIAFEPTQIKSINNSGEFDGSNPNIMYSLDPAEQAIFDRTIASPETGIVSKIAKTEWIKAVNQSRLKEHLIYQFISKLNPFLAYEMKANNGELKDASVSAAKLAEMAINDSGRIGTLFNVGPISWNNTTGYVDILDGKGIEEIFKFLSDPDTYKRFSLYATAKRAQRLKTEGRENLFTDTDIATGLSYANTMGKFKKETRSFEDIFNDYQKFNKDLLEGMGLNTGLLSQEQFDFYTQHMDYVPFYRYVDETGELPSISWMKKQINNPDPKIHKLVGGKQQIGDLIENIAKNATALTAAGMRNVVMDRLHSMALSMGEGSIVKSGGIEDGVLTYTKQGNKIKFIVDDPLLVAAVSSMRVDQLSAIMKFGASVAGFVRNGIVALPPFMIANLERGLTAAYLQTGNNISMQNNTLTGLKRAFMGDKSIRELKAMSGTGSYDFGGYSGSVSQRLRRKIGAEKQGFGMGAARKIWAGIEHLGEVTELADRDSIRQNLIKNGATKAEADYQAMNLINYSRHGASKSLRALTMLVPFLNARLQGLYRMGETQKSGAEKGKILMGIALRGAMLTLFSIAVREMMKDDDRYDDEEMYAKLNYWIFYTPLGRLTIPKPFEFGAIFATIPELLLDYAEKENGEELAQGLGMTLANTFAFNPIPQVFKPILENIANYSFFTTRQIESDSLKHKRPGLRAYANTSDTLKAVGDKTDISPVMMENLVRGYTSGFGMTLLGGVDSIGRSIGVFPEKEEGSFGSMPLVSDALDGALGRFYKEGPSKSNKWIGDLYDLSTKAAQIHDNVKTLRLVGDAEAAKKVFDDNKEIIQKKKMIDKTTKALSMINKRINQIRNDTSISKLDKKVQMNAFVKMRNDLAEKTVKNVKDID